MNRIEMGNKRRKPTLDAVRRRPRLRPTVSELEGRTLLSTFTVTSTADNGSAGTLRWAVEQANASDQASTINFSSQFNTPQKITLTGGPLVLSNPATTTITGPGENVLTISGKNASRVFGITPGSAASLSGLTITGGKVNGNGGGIRNDGGTLALDDVVLRGNSARVGGGLFNNGSATLTDVIARGNHASIGGGVFNKGSATLTDVVTRGNTAVVGSGVFSARTATLTRSGLSIGAPAGTIVNQTFNGNGLSANWQPFLPGTIAETPKKFLTMTDTTGNHVGIMSTLPAFKVVGGPDDDHGENQRRQWQSARRQRHRRPPRPEWDPGRRVTWRWASIPWATSTSSSTTRRMTSKRTSCRWAQTRATTEPPLSTSLSPSTTVTPKSPYFQVTAGTFNSGKVSFSKVLGNFSMNTAFPKGAVTAVVAASQPTDKKGGGSASFESINVSTT